MQACVTQPGDQRTTFGNQFHSFHHGKSSNRASSSYVPVNTFLPKPTCQALKIVKSVNKKLQSGNYIKHQVTIKTLQSHTFFCRALV